MKLKTFTNRNLDNLEADVNIWLSTAAPSSVHTMQFSERQSTAITYTVVILYTP